MTHWNGNNAFVPGIHSITAKVLSSLAPGSRALQVRVNAVVKRAAQHTEAGVHDECIKMIGTFIASEGEGLNNQYQSMKLREAKVDYRRKVQHTLLREGILLGGCITKKGISQI